ncbi:MAG TPA: archease [Candidatus Polarisedimenticolia bacterium]|nr:archease [Candidatus Polarisedimenticolia bacterium]
MRPGYEFFEHTADIGVVARGVTLPRLFENAARALSDLICDRRLVRPRRRVRIAVEGSGLEDLLVRWLSELLFRLETQGMLFSSFRVERVDRRRFKVRAVASGEPLDRDRHRLRREVKAITYHQLRVVRGRSAWRVRIVFDV